MDFFSDILPLIFSLLAILLVLYLCYLFSKYLSKKVSNVSSLGNMQVMERVALAQDKGLAIVEICGKYYLLAFSNNSVDILKEIEADSLKTPQSGLKNNFMDILNSTIKSRWDVKTLGTNTAKPGGTEGRPEEEKERRQ